MTAHPAAEVCRFAPSTTGPAHPGTLLAALLCWLDARSRGARVVLRLEDLDPERCKPAFATAMVADLQWLGLDWDEVQKQSDHRPHHEAALDALESLGRLYPCPASRSELRKLGRRAPDGGWAYDNRNRGESLPPGGWRDAGVPIRAQLPDGPLTMQDEGGEPITQDPAQSFGDPVVVRRDGSVAYNLACVVDDHASGVTRVVRGRDIAPSTPTQVRLYELLSYPQPSYRHHMLLLEPRGDKLAKFHGSVGADELRGHYRPEELRGVLAYAAGLLETPQNASMEALLDTFAWCRVREKNRVLNWSENRLVFDGYE